MPGRIIGLKFGALAVFGVLTGLAPDPSQRAVGVAVWVALAVFALRDVLARERLAADRDGVVVVRGYAARRRLAWSEIEAVRVDERLRLGARMQALEIDATDHIYIFGQNELGADPAEVYATLTDLAEASRPSP